MLDAIKRNVSLFIKKVVCLLSKVPLIIANVAYRQFLIIESNT